MRNDYVFLPLASNILATEDGDYDDGDDDDEDDEDVDDNSGRPLGYADQKCAYNVLQEETDDGARLLTSQLINDMRNNC